MSDDPYKVQRHEETRIHRREWDKAANQLGYDPKTWDPEEMRLIGAKMRRNNPGRY